MSNKQFLEMIALVQIVTDVSDVKLSELLNTSKGNVTKWKVGSSKPTDTMKKIYSKNMKLLLESYAKDS